MMKLLEGKTAIVTGAGSGMGKAIAQLFVEQGAKVMFADLNEKAITEICNNYDTNQAKPFTVNVADSEAVSALIDETIDSFGSIDIIVNSAGIPQAFTPIEELSIE